LDKSERQKGKSILVFLSGVGVLGSVIYDIAAAPKSAERYNEQIVLPLLFLATTAWRSTNIINHRKRRSNIRCWAR
jgi:hypothetical protein